MLLLNQNEYIAKHDERLSFISNFTGSQGISLVTLTEQIVWTDSRYWLSAVAEMHSGWQLKKQGTSDETLSSYIVRNADSIKTVGFDPQLMSYSKYVRRRYSNAAGQTWGNKAEAH